MSEAEQPITPAQGGSVTHESVTVALPPGAVAENAKLTVSELKSDSGAVGAMDPQSAVYSVELEDDMQRPLKGRRGVYASSEHFTDYVLLYLKKKEQLAGWFRDGFKELFDGRQSDPGCDARVENAALKVPDGKNPPMWVCLRADGHSDWELILTSNRAIGIDVSVPAAWNLTSTIGKSAGEEVWTAINRASIAAGIGGDPPMLPANGQMVAARPEGHGREDPVLRQQRGRHLPRQGPDG